MIFTLAGIALAAAALCAILMPLWWQSRMLPAQGRFDSAVYRDQLAEIARDAERGLVTAADAASARREIERRLLAASDRLEPLRADVTHHRLALILGVAGVAAAFGLYLFLGSPELHDLPYAARANTPAGTPQSVSDMVAGLAARLKQQPDDADGWVMLGRSYIVLGDAADAAQAYANARRLRPDDPSILLNEADAIVMRRGDDDPIPPPALALFKSVNEKLPDEPEPLWFLGIAAKQAQDFAAAEAHWQHLLRVLPENSVNRPGVVEALNALGQKSAASPPANQKP